MKTKIYWNPDKGSCLVVLCRPKACAAFAIEYTEKKIFYRHFSKLGSERGGSSENWDGTDFISWGTLKPKEE